MLVISNVKETTDALISSLEVSNASIITKEIRGDVNSLAEQATKLYEGGRFDYVIVVPDDPVGAQIILNKSEGVRCAVCKTERDVDSAKSHGANMIIIDDPQPDRFSTIISSLSRKGPLSLLGAKPRILQKAGSEQAQIHRAPQHAASRPQAKAPEDKSPDEQRQPAGPRRKGLSGVLKDYLGIID